MQQELINQPVRQSRVGGIIGGLLFVPALLYGLVVLLWPSLRTISTSMMKTRFFGPGQWVGLENYRAMLSNGQVAGAFGFTALLIGVRLIVVALVLTLLIWAFRQIGGRGRSAILWLFALPLALFSPTAMAIAWRTRFAGSMMLVSPDSARWAFIGVDALLTFGVVLGIGAVCAYLLSYRQPDGQTRRNPTLITVLCALFAVIALGLQSWSLGMALTNGGPQNATQSVSFLAYRISFQFMDFGSGAALNTILMLIVGVLGVITAVLLIANEVQIAPASPRAEPVGGGSRIAALAVLAVLLLIGLFGLSPLFAAMRSSSGVLSLFGVPSSSSEFLPTEEVMRASVLGFMPSLLSVLVVQVPFTYLTALAIGWLRPLGRYSEWLLLLLAPWLFMTDFPLALTFFEQYQRLGLLNSLAALQTPFLLCIPGVFVLTFFFKGHQPHWEAARQRQEPYAFLRLVLLPSLPLVIMLAVGLLIVQTRALYWPFLMLNDPNLSVGTVTLIRLMSGFIADPAEISLLIAPLSLSFSAVWFVVLGVLLAFGLPGLHLRAGGEGASDHRLG